MDTMLRYAWRAVISKLTMNSGSSGIFCGKAGLEIDNEQTT